jgi:hypothetical protein
MSDKAITKTRSGALPEIRCQCCNRLLFKGQVEWVEIKCPKCNHCQTVTRAGILAGGIIMGRLGGKRVD